MPMTIIRNDITAMNVDAIVNAANPLLQKGGGVCGAIFSAAGTDELQDACNQIGGCETGQAVITDAFLLPSRYIIHSVGPVWQGGDAGEKELLHSCYVNSLKLAVQHRCASIAFPLISSGIYGFPKDKAMHTAVSAISEFLFEHEVTVYLVVYDTESFMLSKQLDADIRSYIDEHSINEVSPHELRRQQEVSLHEAAISFKPHVLPRKRKLEEFVNRKEETFSQMLFRIIAEKGLTEVQTYKRANIDRKLFSKIRSNTHYQPSRTTAAALAVALELTLDETCGLLERAGFALSRSHTFDLIIEYFITSGNYHIHEINEALFAFDQPLLGV